MNVTLDQIKDLNIQESEYMRRFSRRCLKRIAKRNRQAKDQYEQEQDFERKLKCQL